MSSVNKVILVGRLGADPVVRYLPSGDAVTNFSLATSERWKDKATGEPRESTEWHRVNLFGRLAEIAGQYLKKGALVYIEGSLHTRKYTDKDNIERYSTEVKGFSMTMLGGSPGAAGSEPAAMADMGGSAQPPAPSMGSNNRKAAAFDDLDDDIPF